MSKHKYIKSPEDLYQLWIECRTEIEENPIKVQDYVGKDADEVYRLKQRPFTYEALKVYANKKGLTVNHYFENTKNAYNEYCDVCRAIKDEIRLNQIEGGMVGIYNPSITQRLNGLADKQEIESKVTQTTKIDLSNYTDEELRILTELQRKGGISEA